MEIQLTSSGITNDFLYNLTGTGAGVLLGNFNPAPTSTGSTRDLILETNKDTEALKSVYDMRISLFVLFLIKEI